jgi:uncharacterized protein (TIGR02300 family)
VAKPELGSKHQCQHCGTKFFDLLKNPITCPKCGTIFQALPTTTRAARNTAPDDDEPDTDAAEHVSLEDAEATEDKVAAVVDDDDVEIEDEPADDDTFLEEEEEDNDDVTGLIDGDIEEDEER